MTHQRTPFDSIEGSLEYVGLLREAVQEAKDSVAEEAARAGSEGAVRRLEALRLVTYKLDRLCGHVDATRRLTPTRPTRSGRRTPTARAKTMG